VGADGVTPGGFNPLFVEAAILRLLVSFLNLYCLISFNPLFVEAAILSAFRPPA